MAPVYSKRVADEPEFIIPRKKLCRLPEPVKKKLLILVLFGGTCSWTRTIRLLGLQDKYEVVELDIDTTFGATYADVLTWDFRKWFAEHPDVFMIWASPPCDQVSQANTTGVRDLETATKLFRRTRKIIRYCLDKVNPNLWYAIENPSTGLLCKARGDYDHIPIFDSVFPHIDIDYCRYSKPPAGPFDVEPSTPEQRQIIWNWEFPYQKQTRLWTNIRIFPKECQGKRVCHMCDEHGHVATYGNGKRPAAPRYKKMLNTDFAHRLPPLLIKDLLDAAF